MLKKIINALLVFSVILYPILMYFSLKKYSPRLIAILIGLIVITSIFFQKRAQYNSRLLVPIFGMVILCLVSAISNQADLILYLPLLISLNLFFSFGYSLLHPPSMVEIFARRMSGTEFNHEQLRYCRLVTLTWVVFFALNGTLAGVTACCTVIETWSLYNGLISYGAIGLLFAAELCYRYWRFRRYVGLPTDFLFRKVFPPRD